MSFAWPEQRVDLAEAARLFCAYWIAAGVERTVSRSSLSRYVSTRRYPTTPGPKGAKLVVAKQLFDAYDADFGRQLMAGQTGGGASSPSQAPAPPSAPAYAADDMLRDDPSRDLKRIQAHREQIALEKDLGRILTAEEVAAGLAASLGELRAALSQQARTEGSKLLAELGLPGTKLSILIAGLKRYGAHGQEAWAAKAAALLEASKTPGTSARERLDALAAYDIELRAGEDANAPEQVSEGAPAPSESSGEA